MVAALINFLEFIGLMADLAISALSFSGDAFREVTATTSAQWAALAIAFLAGVSEMLGQSVILVVNRTPLYRFLASLAFTGATYALTAVVWGLSVLAVAPLTRVGALGFADFLPVIGVLGLAFAPRILGVLSIAPYFGVALGHALEAFAMVLAIFGLHVGLDLPSGAAVFCGLAGWGVSTMFRTFLGRAFAKPLRRLRRTVSGSALEKAPAQIVDDIMARLGGGRKS